MTVYTKAIVGALVAAATYLAGVIPASGGFGDVTAVGWLGLVPVLAGAFGVVYASPPNTDAPRRRGERGATDAVTVLVVIVLVLVVLALLGYLR